MYFADAHDCNGDAGDRNGPLTLAIMTLLLAVSSSGAYFFHFPLGTGHSTQKTYFYEVKLSI